MTSSFMITCNCPSQKRDNGRWQRSREPNSLSDGVRAPEIGKAEPT